MPATRKTDMSQSLLPRLRAGSVALIATVMLAAPVAAQDINGQSGALAPAAVETPAPAETAPVATPPAAMPVGPAPAAPDSVTPATPMQAPETAPAEATTEAPAEPAISIVPQAIQDALSPLAPHARDPKLPHDLSPMGMFWAADWVVKGVMIGLAFASVVTWTLLIVKLLELGGAMSRVQSGTRRVEAAASLSAMVREAGKRKDPVSRMVRAAQSEYARSAAALDTAGDGGLKERVDSHLDRIQAIASRRMGRGTGILATIGSTAPFVGLFGTVWGIMNSFIGISESQTTNLAVVAPGIAEALLATAIGLVAAIPAVIIYNLFARAITGYRLQLATACAGVRRLISRDLDFRGVTARPEA